MKYACFFEYDQKDTDEVINRFKKMVPLRGTPDYPKAISPTYGYGGQSSGFTLYEVDNPQQIINHSVHYIPLMKLNWVPVVEATD
ncbi:hypothetical protein FJY84_08740, partial [Candidatus Bathyarchaeota archaeon]|nr:hypothetical protein [Candidatus Bathyarchaeota archaeon]